MANANIKISQLPNIGSNLNNNTLLPVVSTNGTFLTDKVTVGNLANFILDEAGNTLANAFVANIAYSVANAAQPNITSLGNLTSLRITNLANLHIPGGTNGYVLQTNGNGNLSWTAMAGGGNGVPGGSNTQVQFNDSGVFNGSSGLTYNKTTFTLGTGNLQANNATISGNISTANINTTGNISSNLFIGNGISPTGANFFIGNLAFNDSTIQLKSGANNQSIRIAPDGSANSYAFLQIPDNDSASSLEARLLNQAGNVEIVAGDLSTLYAWYFRGDGFMTTPGPISASGDITTNGNIAGGNLFGDGGNISNISGANIVGTVANANYAIHVDVEPATNNFSYHVVLVENPGDNHLVVDGDDNLQYNPADGTLTTIRLDTEYLNVTYDVVSNLIPFSNVTYDLGNSTNRWKDIYLSNSSIYLGDATITANGNSIVVDSITVNNGNIGTIGNIASLNLTGSSSNVLYGNGVFAPAGGGSSNQSGFSYTVGDRLVAGEFETNNNNPANVTTISLNPTDNGNIDIDTLMTYLNDKDIVVTISDTNNQASFNVNDIQPIVSSYNGYKAVYTKLWDDDPGFSKIGFYKDTANVSVTVPTDTDDDEFTVQITSGSSDLLGFAIIYTDNSSFIPTNANLTEYFEYFVDNILVPASGNIGGIKTNFYGQVKNTTQLITSWGETPWNMEFWTNSVNSIYTSVSSSGTSGSGTGFTADIITAGTGGYIISNFNGGSGYQVGDTITFDGTLLGGVSSTNDYVLVVGTVDGSGAVLTYADSGTHAGAWPTDYINDGGGDIYDDGNYIQTNQQATVPYSNGDIQNTGAFNTNEWFVGYAYGQFIFFGDNTGDPVNSFGTYGETGSDGDGLRETGDLSPVQYFDLNVHSVLDYTPGMDLSNGSYKINFDNGGVYTNGVVFDPNNVNTITTLAGDLYLKAADDVRIQATDYVQVKGGDKVAGQNDQGGWVGVFGGQGSYANTSVGNETQAGSGGEVEIYGGSAGYDGGNTSLGAQGGRVVIQGGDASGNSNGGEVRLAGGSGSGTGTRGNVVIQSGISVWTFDNTGNLILPNNTFAVNYANGTQVPLGGGGNTGNVTFDDVTVQGVNGLNLSAGADFTANLAYLQVRAGDVASHIHLDTGNNSAYDLIVGDDQNYIQVSSTGNILLSSYDSNTGQYTWTLDYNGNLILAGGNSIIQSFANSSLDPLNTNVSTMVFTPDQGYGSQALVLDPTLVGHIHLRAPATLVDEPFANIFLGGEITAFEVTSGANNQAVIHSGGNDWTFGNDGNLTIPGTSGGFIKTVANSSIGIAAMDNGTNNPAQLMLLDAGTGAAATIISAYNSNATIQTNVSGTINTWSFNDDGTLSLPTSSYGYAQLYTTGANLYLGNSGNPINIQTNGTITSNGNLAMNAITATGNVTATGKIGYSTGGAVTQSSSGAGVTLNQLTGEITLAKNSWTAGDLEAFVITTNKVSNNDFILAQLINSVYVTSFNVNAYVYSIVPNSIMVNVKALESVTSTPTVKFFILKAPVA